jgi:hypothetical protein
MRVQPSGALDGRGSARRMLHAISAASIGSGTDHELDAAAQQLVLELRAANQPPEQVLLHIKAILAEAGLRPSHALLDPDLVIERHDSVYRNVIESTIRHYFRNSDGDSPSVVRATPRET